MPGRGRSTETVEASPGVGMGTTQVRNTPASRGEVRPKAPPGHRHPRHPRRAAWCGRREPTPRLSMSLGRQRGHWQRSRCESETLVSHLSYVSTDLFWTKISEKNDLAQKVALGELFTMGFVELHTKGTSDLYGKVTYGVSSLASIFFSPCPTEPPTGHTSVRDPLT
jgi:hypothetical protein